MLCVSKICDRGYYVDFMKNHCEVITKKTHKLVLTGYRHENIYETNLYTNSDDPATCSIGVTSVEESWNWDLSF